MVTEAIKHELVDQRGIKAIVRSECVPPSSSEGDYCIDIGYFFSAHRRTPPILGVRKEEGQSNSFGFQPFQLFAVSPWRPLRP